MAANLALSDSTITLPDGEVIVHAHLLVRDNRLRVRSEGHPDVVVTGVTAVESAGRNKWSIVTGDGSYLASARDCGCS